MPKKGHSEEQIVAVLRRLAAGAGVAEVCREAEISEATYPDKFTAISRANDACRAQGGK